MNTARVYKVRIRENVLRQMLFTNRNILIVLVAAVCGLIWFLGRMLNTHVKVFLSLGISGVMIVGLMARIDRQPSYEILARAIPYFLRKRTLRF